MRKHCYFLFLTFLLLFHFKSISQESQNLDSLINTYHLPDDINSAFKQVNDTFYYFMENDFSSAIKVYPLLHYYGNQVTEPYIIAEFFKTKSYYFDFNNQSDSSIFFLNKGIELLDSLGADELKYIDLKAKLYNALAIIYHEKELYQPAIKAHHEAIGLAEYIQNFEENNRSYNSFLAWAYNDAALTYSYTADTPSTLKFFRMANNLARKKNLPDDQAIFELNFGVYLFDCGETDSALSIFLDAKNLLDRKGSLIEQSVANMNLAKVYIKMNRFKEAEVILDSSIQALNNSGFYYYLGQAYLIQSNLYYQWKNYPKALKAAQNLSKTLTKTQSAHLEGQCNMAMADIYEKLDQPAKALPYLQKYIAALDSLKEIEVKNRINNLDLIFDLKNTLAKNEKLLATNQDQEKELKLLRQNSLLYYVIVVLSIILLIFFLYILLNNRSKNISLLKKNKELEEATEELQKTIDLNKQLFGILSHDLRGPIGTAKSIVNLIYTSDLDSKENRQLLKTMGISINNTYDLLENMLYWSMNQMEKHATIRTSFSIKDLVDEVILSIESTLFTKEIRFNNYVSDVKINTSEDFLKIIIRNVITNAVKFSKRGESIDILFEENNQDVILNVVDHGIGMDSETLKMLQENMNITPNKGTEKEYGSGLGLMVTRDLVNKINGSISFTSEPDKGTSVKITLPK